MFIYLKGEAIHWLPGPGCYNCGRWNIHGEANYSTQFHRIGPLGRFDLVVTMSVCCSLFVCVSPFHVLYFEAYFAPTSGSRIANIFRDLESLGKSAGKKWSQNWTFLLGSCLKLQRKKKVSFFLILPYKTWWKPRFPIY